MGYILIDTCVWINLASSPELRSLVDEIVRVAPGKPHAVVVPHSVSVEFTRNSKDIVRRREKALKSHIANVKHLHELVPELSADIEKIKSAAQSALAKDVGDVARATGSVQRVLDGGLQIQHDATDYEDAGRRCLDHRAPANTPKRSSIGDSLLWRAALRLLEQHCVWFCTANHNDFSRAEQADELHPDLQKEVTGKKHKLYYFNDPNKMLEHLRELEKMPAPTSSVPKYVDFFPRSVSLCPGDGEKLVDAGFSPSQYGGWTWKKACPNCHMRYDTGEFMDD